MTPAPWLAKIEPSGYPSAPSQEQEQNARIAGGRGAHPAALFRAGREQFESHREHTAGMGHVARVMEQVAS